MNGARKNTSTAKSPGHPAAARGKDTPFRAVEIRCDSNACAAALALKSSRFLSRQSPPTLPLQDCDRPGGCTCKYLHHTDRRDDPRREVHTGIWQTTFEPQDNRRRRPGRRTAD